MDDQTLVRSILNGNTQAFSFLIRKYEKLVFHMVQKLVTDEPSVEELGQDVFMKVYEKLPGFRFESKLSTWIATIAYRQTVNHLRKNKRMQYKALEEASEDRFFVERDTPASSYESKDTGQFVQAQIEKLPAHYRNILYLYHIEELTYPEIVEITRLPLGTVKNYLFRARKLLKDQLSNFIDKEALL